MHSMKCAFIKSYYFLNKRIFYLAKDSIIQENTKKWSVYFNWAALVSHLNFSFISLFNFYTLLMTGLLGISLNKAVWMWRHSLYKFRIVRTKSREKILFHLGFWDQISSSTCLYPTKSNTQTKWLNRLGLSRLSNILKPLICRW